MYELELEKSLVLAAQAGDRDAFGRLYTAILPGLYGYIRSRMPSTVEAEDLVSDVILMMVKKLGDFRWLNPGSFRAWVFQIARRKLVDKYRRSTVPNTEIDGNETLPDPAPTPEMQVLCHETREGVLGLVEKLSPRKQEVILLRYFGGLQNNEIAAVLELDERTISSYLSRAMDELQANLASNANELFLTKEYTYDRYQTH